MYECIWNEATYSKKLGRRAWWRLVTRWCGGGDCGMRCVFCLFLIFILVIIIFYSVWGERFAWRSVRLRLGPSVGPSVSLSVRPSVYPPVWLYLHVTVWLSACLPACLPVCLAGCLSLSVCPWNVGTPSTHPPTPPSPQWVGCVGVSSRWVGERGSLTFCLHTAWQAGIQYSVFVSYSLAVAAIVALFLPSDFAPVYHRDFDLIEFFTFIQRTNELIDSFSTWFWMCELWIVNCVNCITLMYNYPRLAQDKSSKSAFTPNLKSNSKFTSNYYTFIWLCH